MVTKRLCPRTLDRPVMVNIMGLSFELSDLMLAVVGLMVYWVLSALIYWTTGIQFSIIWGVVLSAGVLWFLVKTKAGRPRGSLQLLFYRWGVWGKEGGLPAYREARKYVIFSRKPGKDTVMKVIDLAKRRAM